MKASGIAFGLALLIACSVTTQALAKGASDTSCPGVSTTTIKQAQAAAFAAVCAAGQSCATNSAECKKAALQSSLKTSFMSLMTTFNIGPFCAGAIVAAVAQSGTDGNLSPLACK
jgi:hypothetical protein